MRLRHSLLLGFSLCTAASFAWHDSGHKTIGRLALKGVGSKTQALNELLANLPAADSPENSFIAPFPFEKYPPGVVTGTPNLFNANIEDASVWPDVVRRTWMDRPTWHYINHRIVYDGIVPPPLPEENVETAIVKIAKLARDPNISAHTRAACIAWLCHLVGDIHQPLHSVALFDKEHPEGDRGGNNFFPKEDSDKKDKSLPPINLHAYWDSVGHLGDAGVDGLLKHSEKYAVKESTFSLANLEKEVKKWGAESEKLAKDYVYRVAGPGSARLTTNEAKWFKNQRNYRKLAQVQCLKRIRQAGSRLGRLLYLVLQ